MNLREQISNYQPFNEQEIADKEVFLNYLDNFDNILIRDNIYAHFSASAFVINEDHTKVLMVHHNIFNSWSYPGGHADGEANLQAVAMREVEEEVGIKITKVLSNGPYAIHTNPTVGHFKKNKYVSAHTHLDVAFLFEADDKVPLTVKEDENTLVGWLPISECVISSREPFMQNIFAKIIAKMQAEGIIKN